MKRPAFGRTFFCAIWLGMSVFLAVPASMAHAYQIGGRFGHSCHEEIAYDSFIDVLETFAPNVGRVELPTDRTTLRVIDGVRSNIKKLGRPLSQEQAFILMSLFVGVRAPDSDGHASGNLAHTRAEHADPDDSGQYVHACRGKHDDYVEGDFKAIEGARESFMQSVRSAYKYRSATDQMLNIQMDLYLDYYGMVDLTVNATAYYYGYAAHLVADSFSHTVRSYDDQFHKIVAVMNYVEAIYPGYKEERDGLRHSDFTDDCTEEENQPVVAAAIEASRDFAIAFAQYYETGDETFFDGFWRDWFEIRTDCQANFDVCGSGYWAEIAREDATRAYLECASEPRSPGASPTGWMFLVSAGGLAGGAGLWRRRRRENA